MATAMPRRRTNQCEMSAISGPKLAEQPTPISSPCASATCHRLAGEADGEIAEPERDGPERQRHGNAEAVGEPAHQHAAAGKADHGQRVGQRGVGAGDAEVGLDGRQRHHHRPHADAADGAEQHGHDQPQPGGRGIGRIRPGRPGGCVRWSHGDDKPGYYSCPL